MTSTEQINHEKLPVLYHLDRDPGEKYPIRINSEEYLRNVKVLKEIERQHRATFPNGFAKPVLNWCDRAVEVSELNIFFSNLFEVFS